MFANTGISDPLFTRLWVMPTNVGSDLPIFNYILPNFYAFIRVILYGDINFDNVTNFKIITATIKFIKTTKRFEEALF